MLDSEYEYKQVLLVYAKKIADEGFRAKAEELVKELFGPIYWYGLYDIVQKMSILMSLSRRPGMAKEDNWCPTLLGYSKRELLKDVLSIFGTFADEVPKSSSQSAHEQLAARH